MIGVLDLEVAHTTTHIPDDIFLLPVDSESLRELVIGLIHNMEWSIVGSFETPLIDRDE